MLHVHDEVRTALAEHKPVVALESTILAHGMPYPENLALGRALEAVIRQAGAVPATVAVMRGELRVGLDANDLTALAHDKDVSKVTRRDLPFAIASRGLGATTVSATMFAAARAGVRFFATGGIGGVHRGFEATHDVSSDLTELAQTSVCVVCAGAKSILDLPRTLEVLETLAVPVVGWRTHELPAFFSRSSGLHLEHRVEGAEDLARILRAKWGLGLEGGVVLAVPPPNEAALPRNEVEAATDQALAAAERAGIRGKATTPFLLKAIRDLLHGRSVAANMALALENARVAAECAAAYVR